MKKIVILLLFLPFYQLAFSQLNIQLLDQRSYEFDTNDIWGWVAEDGTEYALVGTVNGTSIVSLADPTNVQEVAFVPGTNTAWRDIKTWGNYAYVTQDVTSANEQVGIAIIDLSKLPNSVEYEYWRPTLDGRLLTDCHNIWIDDDGVCYLAGCDVNNGGMILLDIITDPMEPSVISYAPPTYAHDVYVKDDLMFASQLGRGLGVYDVSDKQDIKLIGQKETPSDFTHNAWTTADNSIVFTTDERANAPVASYSVSPNGTLEELDQFKPLASINRGVIPHNVHVLDDWVVASYYTDGVVIIDGTRPGNMVEVGNFDTWSGNDGGFKGSWGAYPFLPSGNLLVTDIDNGLYVLKADYQRACWLEGNVTDAETGNPIFDVQVSIAASQLNRETSDLNGDYATGLAESGSYAVTYSKFGYESKTINVTLNNGVLVTRDVALTPINVYTIAGLTVEDGNGQIVPSTRIIFKASGGQFAAIADMSGQFSFQNILEGTYDIYALAWGYLHKVEKNVTIQANQSITLELTPGYQDDFIVDLGWEKEADDLATTGFWVLDEPIGTYINANLLANPEFDIDTDLGENCYMTGNGGGNTGTDDVDNGSVTLTSPIMDLSTYEEPALSYHLWFQRFNSNQGATEDSLVVSINNGLEEVTIEVLADAQNGWREKSEIFLRDWIEITSTMTISFTTSDFAPVGNAVEAAVDAFLVRDAGLIATEDPNLDQVEIKVFPNPFQDQIFFDYSISNSFGKGRISIHNVLGQVVGQHLIQDKQGRLGLRWPGDAGIYFIRLEIDGRLAETLKVIKQ